MSTSADYTYDRATDQFVVTLDDGTEVCRTSAPHTHSDKVLAADIAEAVSAGRMAVMGDGTWDLSGLTSTLQFHITSHRVTFFNHQACCTP